MVTQMVMGKNGGNTGDGGASFVGDTGGGVGGSDDKGQWLVVVVGGSGGGCLG